MYQYFGGKLAPYRKSMEISEAELNTVKNGNVLPLNLLLHMPLTGALLSPQRQRLT